LEYYNEIYNKVKDSPFKKNFLKKPADLNDQFIKAFATVIRFGEF